MNAIFDFIICSTLAFAFIGSVETLISDRFRPYVKLVSGLFVLLLLAKPVIESARDLMSDIEIYDSTFQGEDDSAEYSSYVNVFKDQLCISVKDYVLANTDLQEEDLYVEAFIDDSDIGKIKIELIRITVITECDAHGIERIVSVFYNTPTEIVIDNEKNN